MDKSTAEVLYWLKLAIFFFGTVTIMFFCTRAAITSHSVTSATSDLLMSEDMASFTQIYGQAAVFDEGDME